MDRTQVEQSVKEILARRLNRPMEEIHLESDLAIDLSMDSFDAVEVMFELEEKFDVEILDEQITDLRLVKDIVNLLMAEAS